MQTIGGSLLGERDTFSITSLTYKSSLTPEEFKNDKYLDHLPRRQKLHIADQDMRALGQCLLKLRQSYLTARLKHLFFNQWDI